MRTPYLPTNTNPNVQQKDFGKRRNVSVFTESGWTLYSQFIADQAKKQRSEVVVVEESLPSAQNIAKP